MLFRPVEIDFAGSHGLERPLHPERADIDVAEDQSDEQNRTATTAWATCASCISAMPVP
jgi:hypothetical protein